MTSARRQACMYIKDIRFRGYDLWIALYGVIYRYGDVIRIVFERFFLVLLYEKDD